MYRQLCNEVEGKNTSNDTQQERTLLCARNAYMYLEPGGERITTLRVKKRSLQKQRINALRLQVCEKGLAL
jgi:hypothetical protein